MAVEHGCSVLRTVSPLSSPPLTVVTFHVNNTTGYPVGGERRIIKRKVSIQVGVICVDMVANSVFRDIL